MATKTTPTKKKTVKKAPAKRSAVKAKKVEEETPKIKPEPEIPEIKEEETEDEKLKRPERYFEGTGRRKTSVARVRLYTKVGEFLVNDKHYTSYFPTLDQQKIVEEALQKMKLFGRFKVLVKINGGGIHSQAEALRHGLSRCLIKFNPDFRKRLKRAGFLMRDPRAKERKKFGLKKARRAPQWAKR